MGYLCEWQCIDGAAYLPQTRKRVFLVGYLDPRCAGEILPIERKGGKALSELTDHQPQGKRVYDAGGAAITQTASCGGFGGKTGLYLVDYNENSKFTDTARCITARQDSGMSHHKGEHSAVFFEYDGVYPVINPDRETSILHILYALFPIGCDRYVEPFGGSGAVLLGKPVPDKFEVFNDYNHNLVNLFRCMRDRPMEFIRELGFLSLNSRDDFAVLKKFFEKEEFAEEYLKAQLDLTEIMLPEVTAREVRTLYSAARNDHDLRRAVMFLKLIRYA